jgi:putative transposase
MDDQDFENLVRNSSSIGHRRSIRLEGYDYASEGGYFITLVTHHHIPLFGKVIDDKMIENEFGQIVRQEWFRTARMRPHVELLEDEFVVMPNHIHGIIWQFGENNTKCNNGNSGDLSIVDRPLVNKGCDLQGTGDLQVARTRPTGPDSGSIGAIIAGFKSLVTKRINTIRQVKGEPVWLRNYYEHIITTEKEYENIVDYIQFNPMNWGMKDEYYFRE